MKILVVSDIHSNADALRAVLDAESGSCSGIFCLGDTVGYGPDSEECVRIVRSFDRSFEPVIVLSGNHEAGVSGAIPEAWFNPNALAGVRRARESLAEDALAWIAALKPTARFSEDVLLSHGSPVEPTTGYLFGGYETEQALSFMAASGIGLCFCGHTHDASAFGLVPSGFSRFPEPGAVLHPGTGPVIVNPGSVGFPRSFNGGRTADMPGTGKPISESSFPAYYAVWDPDEGTVTFRDVRYDRRPLEKRIAELG